MSLKDGIRSAIYRLLYTLTGAGRGVRVILLYHSVSRERVVHSYSIPLAGFEEQMRFLKANFKVVRLCDLPKAMETETPNGNITSLTFDDGCLDNYEVALPVLERLGMKATFFIVAGRLGGSLDIFAGSAALMHKEHIRELHSLGHEIGAHTVNHVKLTKLPVGQARKEIEESKQILEDLLGTEVVSFAYPRGDYNAAVKREVAASGFRLAVTIQEGLVPLDPDWLALPRVWIPGYLSPRVFAAKVSPAVMWYEWLRGKRQPS